MSISYTDCAAGVDIHKLYGYYGDNMHRYHVVHNFIQNWHWLMNNIYILDVILKIKAIELGLACSTLKMGSILNTAYPVDVALFGLGNSLNEVRLAPIRITQTARAPDFNCGNGGCDFRACNIFNTDINLAKLSILTPCSKTLYLYPIDPQRTSSYPIQRANHHASTVWDWYHFIVIAYLYQPRPWDEADVKSRLQRSNSNLDNGTQQADITHPCSKFITCQIMTI